MSGGGGGVRTRAALRENQNRWFALVGRLVALVFLLLVVVLLVRQLWRGGRLHPHGLRGPRRGRRHIVRRDFLTAGGGGPRLICIFCSCFAR